MENLNPQIREVLTTLKEATNEVALNPCKRSLENLCFVVKTVDSNIVNKFGFYIFYPICVHLSHKNKDEDACVLLKHLSELLKVVSILSFDTFWKLTQVILYQVQDLENIHTLSEELKLLVVCCFKHLIKSSSKEVLKAFFCRSNYHKISAAVFVCTSIAKGEKCITLKCKSLKCLMFLTQVNSNFLSDNDYKAQIVDTLILMVPGLMTACLEIINRWSTQNHKVILFALNLWSKVLIMVADETTYDESQFFQNDGVNKEEDRIKDTFSDHSQFFEKLRTIKRDDNWLESTDKHLSAVTEPITELYNHKHHKVRSELALSAYMILEHCGRNLPSSVGFLVEALILLSQDDDDSIADDSKSYIHQLCLKCEDASSKSFLEAIEDNFFTLLTRLPRILNGKDMTLKENTLLLFSGYLDVLGEKHLPAIFSSAQHYNRFIHCLLTVAAPDCSSISFLEEVAIRDLNNSSFSSDFRWRHMKNCETAKCVSNALRLFSNVVRLCEKEILLNCLLDEFNNKNSQRKEVSLLMIYLISLAPPKVFYPHSNLIKDVVYAVMEPYLWNIPIYCNDEISKQTLQENIVQICLLADVVGWLAIASGLDNFSPLLLQCLYPLLECAGSPINIIASAGHYAVYNMSNLYERKVSALISGNIDYLTHHITLKLRQAHRNPRVLSALSVIMNYSGLDMLSSLHELIYDVLRQSCDFLQDKNTNTFLYVFKTYLTCIESWMCGDENSTSKTFTEHENKWLNELLEYDRNLKAVQDIQNEDTPEDVGLLMQSVWLEKESTTPCKEPEKVLIPEHIKVTADILKRTLHFLPANNLPRQIICLQILNKGIQLFSNMPDELLPLVHKLWSPLVGRFKSTNPLLVQRAFSLLVTLAKHSKDFIKVRTIKDVLPLLTRTLEESSKESKNKSPVGAYTLTQTYKLQLLLLSSLGQVARDLELPPSILRSLLVSATPYLSSRQPLSLHEACMNMFKELSTIYSDVIWVHLMTVCPPEIEMKSNIDHFPVYKFDNWIYNRNEYIKSVDLLLSFL